MSKMPRVLIGALLALCFTSACPAVREYLRDPEDRIFAGDPGAFLGKKVIVKFRWGDRRMYGEAIFCILLGVEEDHIIVRGLHLDNPAIQADYVKLHELGKLLPVEGQPGVFRIHRTDINLIFEPRVNKSPHAWNATGTVLPCRFALTAMCAT